jgi:glycerol-3-phosphate cytidylyltransferase
MRGPDAHPRVYPVGYASGVFDMFHVGHLNILRRAKERCELLVAGVASDAYVVELKGDTPVIPEAERLEIVASIVHVDEVLLDRSQDKTLAWKQRQFDVIFKGDDWAGTDKGIRLEETMGALGVDVVYFPYTRHTSSTELRRRLQDHHWL